MPACSVCVERHRGACSSNIEEGNQWAIPHRTNNQPYYHNQIYLERYVKMLLLCVRFAFVISTKGEFSNLGSSDIWRTIWQKVQLLYLPNWSVSLLCTGLVGIVKNILGTMNIDAHVKLDRVVELYLYCQSVS